MWGFNILPAWRCIILANPTWESRWRWWQSKYRLSILHCTVNKSILSLSRRADAFYLIYSLDNLLLLLYLLSSNVYVVRLCLTSSISCCPQPGSVQERDRSGKTALHYCAENPTLTCIDQVSPPSDTQLIIYFLLCMIEKSTVLRRVL